MKLQYLDVLDPKDIETAFRAASKGRAEAVFVLQARVLNSQRTEIVEPRGKEPAPGDILQTRVLWKPGAYDLRRRTSPTCTGAPPLTWTRF